MLCVSYQPVEYTRVNDIRNLRMINSPPVQLPKTLRLSHTQFNEMAMANPNLRIEQTAEGIIVVMSPTGSESGNRNAELTVEFGIWNRRTKLGKVFDSSTGFRLPNGAMRSPDVAWIPNDRWSALSPEQRQRFAPICPDFVLELGSESDDAEILRQKMQEYVENGSRLGWLILPTEQSVEVFQPSMGVRRQRFDQILIGGDVLPGFSLNLDSIFDRM